MEEIKSSLLNDKDFENVKNSIIQVSQQDGKEKFRVKLIEYINDTSSNDDDQFFYDMLEFARFLNPNDEAVAYTTPNRLIYMNAPGDKIGETYRVWDFVYDHECLHQLWDTFEVGERIKNDVGSYNHEVLNIASDCVINDYLSYYRKKQAPDFGITPDVIKNEFGVDYDRKVDTQYSLYMKLMEAYKKNKGDFEDKLKNDPKFNGKLMPDHVEEEPNAGGGDMSGLSKKHSDDYKKGWSAAIQDALDNKVDPKTFKPKKPKNDYDNGYNDAMDEMKEGMTNGIKLSKGNSGGGSSSDLPQIPWETPPSSSKSKNQEKGGNESGSDNADIDGMSAEEAAKDAQKSASAAEQSAKNAQDKADKSGSASDQKAADKAKEAANKAKSAANAAANAAKNGDEKGAQNTAKEARDAAKDAQSAAGEGNEGNDDPIDKMSGSEAATNAQQSADKAKKAADQAKAKAAASGSEGDKKEADMAQKAADKAQKAADNAKKAAKAGKDEEARDAAKEARDAAKAAQSAGNTGSGNGIGGQGQGSGHIDSTLSSVDLKKIKEKAESIIRKYQNKISGDFGEFIAKCKSSVKLQKSGLSIGIQSGAPGWNTIMTTQITAFVKKKVFQKKREIERTYKKINRRSGPITFGDPIIKGKRIKKNKMTINVAFYIDRSGSMGSSIDNVFDACYKICEALKKKFGKEKVVDEVTFKIYAFDTSIEEVQFGKKASCGGGTMDFHQLLEQIKKRSQDFLINVILTDAEFGVREKEVCDFIDQIDGMLQFITNNDNPEVKKISQIQKYKTKLFYILANNTFELD